MSNLSVAFGSYRPDLISNETLVDLFKNSVKHFAGNTALIFHDRQLTYAELDKWSDAIALHLVNNGITRKSTVGIWWPRGLELHAAILGIIKSGAAYVPVDRETPAERLEMILTEIGASACFSMEALNVACPVLQIPTYEETTAILSSIPKNELISPEPEDMAYILYTSGSTGKPKGIPIGHKQICHLVRAEQDVFNVTATDKVYQGFSVSFDMWCEETWLSYFAGATLWVADNTTSKSIDELGSVLQKENITILHAVPSLLAVMHNEVPSLRLINAGGEACTPQVLAKWAGNGLAFYNSYGPTETTVTATIAKLTEEDDIVIGHPLPNYNLAVIDADMNLMPLGEPGELVITGPGVSEGYIGLPELTRQKFIPKPVSLAVLPGDMVYRTGDAAIMLKNRAVKLQGRMDDQVKLRGYRIELGEIESRMNMLAGVSAAAVGIKKDSHDRDHLVGYVMMEDSVCIDDKLLRMELSKTLPAYMIPGNIVSLREMPRLPSGKIDRKALPVPDELENELEDIVIDADAPVGDKVMAILHNVFPSRDIDPSMDFFDDLGGHSLLAAAFVSQLRREAALPYVALKDVYLHRPISSLIAHWEEEQQAQQPSKQRIFNKVPKLRYLLCWAAQSVSLLAIYGLLAFQIFIPYLGYYYVNEETGSLGYSIVTSLMLFALIPPLFTLVCIAGKWLLIGKMKEGDYPLWGSYYFRWWLVKSIQRLLPAQFLSGSPLYPVYLRWLGMKIAPDAQISSFEFGAEDLITIGSDASLSSKTHLNNAFVEDGMLKLRKITIGDHAYIGSSSIVSGDSVIADWGELQDLSCLQAGKTIAEAEVWRGSPAQLKEKKKIEDLPQPLVVSRKDRIKYNTLFMICIQAFPLIILLPLLPTIITINKLDDAAADYNFNYMVTAPLLALLYIMLFAAETIIITRILQYDLKPGKYPIYSMAYVRKWFADQVLSINLVVLHPIYATVFISGFFRALGAKVGKGAEISTAGSVTHPLLEIGDGAFVADAVTLGEADVRGQQLILEKTVIDGNSFVGNSALIPQGYHLQSDMLIGVLSVPPDQEQMSGIGGSDWFGSPAIRLPRRQESNVFNAALTTKPKFIRRLARGTVEFIRTILPESAIICSSILFIAYGHDLVTQEPLWKIILLFPFYYLFYMGLPAFLLTVLLKWLFVGKYKPLQKPMWTWTVWRSEAITSTYEALSVPFLLFYMQGTPWLPLLLRLLGVKTGKRVWMNTTDITEFDMVSIGDDAALNSDCGPQTHLFEDRVMKVGPVKIGARSTIGAGTIVLYDSEIGDDTCVEALSLIMKGERLAPGTNWAGSPVKPS
ncbi:Pls/PosA family non-ribosomal peptide synthetase [Mucilaginibacter mallensis]|nr:Pls/PosA family non-ribosomal peptide synthetase [Mucilaginibacter mallensis]